MSQLLGSLLGIRGAHLVRRVVPAPEAAVIIGRWGLDELAGTLADDAAARDNDGSYTNVVLGADPLVAGSTGRSVRFDGTSSVAVPHVAAVGADLGYEVASYSVVVYFQIAGGQPNINAMLVQKDRGGLPGGFQMGIVSTDGVFYPQIYTKDASAQATFVGSSAGIVTSPLAIGTAYMMVMTVGPDGTRCYVDKVLVGQSGVNTGLLLNDEQIGIGRYRPGISNTAGFNGWIDEVVLYRGALTQAEINALADAQDLVEEGEPPPPPNFITHLNPLARPARARPAYNNANPMSTSYVDPTFGTTVIRITGVPGNAIPNGGGLNWPAACILQFGNTDDVWNADSTLLWVGTGGGDGTDIAVLIDASDNYRVALARSGSTIVNGVNVANVVWDKYRATSNPERMWVFQGNQFRQCFPLAGTVATLETYAGYTNFHFNGQGKVLSDDGRFIAVMATRTSDNAPVHFRINVETGAKGPDVVTGRPDNNNFQISPSGLFLLSRPNGREFNVFDIVNGGSVSLRTLGDEVTHHLVHADGITIGGIEYIWGVGNGGRVNRVRISNGAQFQSTQNTPSLDHISCRAKDDPRYLKTAGFESPTNAALYDQLVAVRIDNGQTNIVRRLCWLYHASPHDYRNQTKPNSDVTGRYTAFMSNYAGGTQGDDGTDGTWICDAGPAWGSEPN